MPIFKSRWDLHIVSNFLGKPSRKLTLASHLPGEQPTGGPGGQSPARSDPAVPEGPRCRLPHGARGTGRTCGGCCSQGEFVSLLLHAVKEPLLLSVLQAAQRLSSAQTRTNFPPWGDASTTGAAPCLLGRGRWCTRVGSVEQPHLGICRAIVTLLKI